MDNNHELKVVTVTTNPDAYPEHAEASVKYPELVRYVDDEATTFVVDPESGNFWPATEFFYMHKVTAFKVDSKELNQ